MPTILVIEDDEISREMILETIQEAGYDVLGAADGSSGIDLARRHEPDLIVSDVRMGDVDGYSVLKDVRAHPATATIPFIIMTGYADAMSVRRSMEKGADDHLNKPFTADELLAAIRARLRRKDLFEQRMHERLDALRLSVGRTIPHEIRTPLSLVLGYAQVLMKEARQIDPAEVAEIGGVIHQAAGRLHRFFENFIAYTQTEYLIANPAEAASLRQAVTPELEHTVSACADGVAQDYGRPDDLVLDLEDGPVAIPEDRLVKIVQELLDNAFKFSEPGRPVIVSARHEAEGVVLRIRDQGRGMQRHQIETLGAFVQIDRPRFEQQGLGLGLTIAARLAHLFGGTLVAESELGLGTTVTVRLPAPQETSVDGRRLGDGRRTHAPLPGTPGQV